MMRPEEQIEKQLMDDSSGAILKDAVIIRRLKASDLQAALEIDREVSGGYNPDVFTAFYEYHPATTFAAEVNGELAGFVLGFKHAPFEGRVFWLAIRTRYQGRGIGMRLMLALLKSFRKLGALGATLEVRVSNRRAQSLYTNLGFQTTAIWPSYYSDGEAAFIMKARL
ncbi:MAG: GNAT family N-acetyltransferase [Methanothrix sp.]|uniref:GNAT family N-acetyltransferase n=1 Tax=Methanothrix sp. TaxID=90426 RepID=UPI003BB1F427